MPSHVVRPTLSLREPPGEPVSAAPRTRPSRRWSIPTLASVAALGWAEPVTALADGPGTAAPLPPPVPEITFGPDGPSLNWHGARGIVYRLSHREAGGAMRDCGHVIAGGDRPISLAVEDAVAGSPPGFLTFFQVSAHSDADLDLLADDWELAELGTADSGGGDDPDGDGVDNSAEFLTGTAPARVDSDRDGLQDGFELAAGGDPVAAPGAATPTPPTAPAPTGLVAYRAALASTE